MYNSTTGQFEGKGTSGTVYVTATHKTTLRSVTFTAYIVELDEGTYFFQNRQTEKYMQPDDDDANDNYINNGGIMEQMPLDGEDYQRWNLSFVGSGYYSIENDRSGYAITVPSGKEGNNNTNLILSTYSGTQNQKWDIIKTENGSYKVKAWSAKNYLTPDLVLAVEVENVDDLLDHLNIQQNDYVDNDSYKDEWYLLELGSEIGIVGILENGHDHASCFNSVLNSIAFIGDYTSVNPNLVSTMTRDECLVVLKNCKIFVSRSHCGGSADESSISLVPSYSTEIRYLSSVSIYDFANDVPLVDLSEVYLAVYVGCETAYGGIGANAKNLVTASVFAGAEYAIGFTESIYCDDANAWTEAFFEALSNGDTVEKAKDHAVEISGITSCVLLSSSDLEG